MVRLTFPALVVMPLLGPLCWTGSAQAALISNLPAHADLVPFSASAPAMLAYSLSVRQHPLTDATRAIRSHVPQKQAQALPPAPETQQPAVPPQWSSSLLSEEGAAIAAAMKKAAEKAAEAPVTPPASSDVWRTPDAPVNSPLSSAVASEPVAADSKPLHVKSSRQRATRAKAKRQRVVRKTPGATVVPSSDAMLAAPSIPVPEAAPVPVVIAPLNEAPTESVVASATPVVAPTNDPLDARPGFWSRYWAALAAPYREAAAAREARTSVGDESNSAPVDHAGEAAALTAVAEKVLPSIAIDEASQVALIPDAAVIAPETVAVIEAEPVRVVAPAPEPEVIPVAAATPIVEPVMIAMPPVAPPPMLPPVMVVAEQVATAPAIPAVVMPAPKLPQWRLEGGKPIDTQLQAWAEASGWKLDWRLDKTWIPPADVFYEGSFDVVIEKIITGLHAEGESVRLSLWSGNRYAEVVHADVK